MNRVGEGGNGRERLARLAAAADHRTLRAARARSATTERGRAERWRAHAASVREALEREAWDGEWYRRATFDDGTWLGSNASEECRIDSIAQSWAVLSGAADPARAADGDGVRRTSTSSAGTTACPPVHAALRQDGARSRLHQGLSARAARERRAIQPRGDVGDPRLREARRGRQGRRTVRAAQSDQPCAHARGRSIATRSSPTWSPPTSIRSRRMSGAGGWTWYTGSAGWMYRAGVEGILGIRREGAFLVVDPCIPAAWPGFEATVELQQNSLRHPGRLGPGRIGGCRAGNAGRRDHGTGR